MRTRASFVPVGVMLLLSVACANSVAEEVSVVGEELRGLPIEDQPGPMIADPVDPGPLPPPAGDLLDPPVETNFHYADLLPDGSIRYIDVGSSAFDLQINVVNIGNAGTQGATTRLSIDGRIFDATLYHYYDGTTDHSNVVLAQQRGYLLVKNYRTGGEMLAPCHVAALQIDIDNQLQYGDEHARDNDTRGALFYKTGSACPLTWTNPINAATTGLEPDSQLKDDRGTGFSLQWIVSSYVSGRRDGRRCSECHNTETQPPYLYNPQIPPGAVSTELVMPYEPISDGEAWWGGNSWVLAFGGRSEKTQYLKDVFSKWISDGGRL